MTPERLSDIVWHSAVPLLWFGMFIALLATSGKAASKKPGAGKKKGGK